MSKVIIKNVECYGNIQDADCVLVSTCEDSFTISPSKNWTDTVNDLLKNDKQSSFNLVLTYIFMDRR